MARKKRKVAHTLKDDRKVIKLMIKGVPYELEYDMFMTLKNLKTGREAPLDTMPAGDLESLSEALETAHEELADAEGTVNAMLDAVYEMDATGRSHTDGWSTGQEVKDVVNTERAVQAGA